MRLVPALLIVVLLGPACSTNRLIVKQCLANDNYTLYGRPKVCVKKADVALLACIENRGVSTERAVAINRDFAASFGNMSASVDTDRREVESRTPTSEERSIINTCREQAGLAPLDPDRDPPVGAAAPGAGNGSLVLPDVTRSTSGQWLDASALPAWQKPFVAGYEQERSLVLCRSLHAGRILPGKVVAGNCNVAWGDDEIENRVFQVLVDAEGLDWARPESGDLPPNTYVGWKNGDESTVICQAEIKNGYHPGWLRSDGCLVPYGNASHLKPEFKILVQD